MSTKIPDGFREDAKGRLVPVETIKEIDLARDELVTTLVKAAEQHSTGLAVFKVEAMATIDAFIAESMAKFKAKVGGVKGNVTLMSFDGRYKVQVQIQDRIAFDERLQAAKVLIDKCISKWGEGADAKLMALVNYAFEVDKEGKLSPTRILSLRRLDVDDRNWKRAMEAIGDSITVTGSKAYLRFYKRIGHSDQYTPVPLDVAEL
ncbi:DUF3164 family protein [Geothrix fuzhouensis]|uniref:DUF3164 family protein n=1 Tax=Geothrix fuzhouensis TaxID=2966451 RepID=UPI00214930F0|nr:DUF3164 family protein [Geothrix fuzhouensis]